MKYVEKCGGILCSVASLIRCNRFCCKHIFSHIIHLALMLSCCYDPLVDDDFSEIFLSCQFIELKKKYQRDELTLTRSVSSIKSSVPVFYHFCANACESGLCMTFAEYIILS